MKKVLSFFIISILLASVYFIADKLETVLNFTLVGVNSPDHFVYAATDKVVAVVNDEVITQSELDSFIKVLSVELSSQYKGKDLDAQIQKMKSDTLERLIEDKLIQQEAKKQKLQVKKEAVTERINKLKSDFPSDSDFYESLKKQGLTMGDIEKKIEDQLIAYRVIDKEVRQKTEVKPSEVTAFYQGNLKEFQDPEKRLVASIFVKNREDAEKITSSLKNGEDFNQLKEKYSAGSSLGEVSRGQLLKGIEDVIFSLKENENSDITKTDEGFYIFNIEKIVPPRVKELSEVQEAVFNYLFEEKMQVRINEWLNTLKSKAHIIRK